MIPTRPARIRQRRRDTRVRQFSDQPGEYRRLLRGDVRRVAAQQLTAGPVLLGMHGQGTGSSVVSAIRRAANATASALDAPIAGRPALTATTRSSYSVVR
ncbi:hypothetical protein [Nocardia iowensis]|uniref:Uncharacterized protein n=1 Tax=Nocardia iowensis TaxID=204891 RepID=A0ABX8RGB4_NOCIO|nr:hypothetical protein [Nocardia iowensis]QXN88649.1 hypothetical protein KV110_23975 [Nocardia iowensis]